MKKEIERSARRRTVRAKNSRAVSNTDTVTIWDQTPTSEEYQYEKQVFEIKEIHVVLIVISTIVLSIITSVVSFLFSCFKGM